MIFNDTLGIKEINKNEVKVTYREAVRAIIIKSSSSMLHLTTLEGDLTPTRMTSKAEQLPTIIEDGRLEAFQNVVKDYKLLMVHSNKGDYKFPGDGIEEGENHEEALRREVEEETGYLVSDVKEKIGVIKERNKDQYEENAVFEMSSHYYLCEISDEKTNQKLDDYEAELEFLPTWIELGVAIAENEGCIKKKAKTNG